MVVPRWLIASALPILANGSMVRDPSYLFFLLFHLSLPRCHAIAAFSRPCRPPRQCRVRLARGSIEELRWGALGGAAIDGTHMYGAFLG